jgi:deoxyribodipyrimidine photo-lyase
MTFSPATRDAGLARLRDFVGKAGEEYASRRNHVPGTVSGLSPYIRHRLVSEEEVAREVLKQHSFQAAEKFLQEVCWRTYWKGWLELRPAIWSRYLGNLAELKGSLPGNPNLAAHIHAAEEGRTGIECFDLWVAELRSSGWLHNHVRMWFASIWVHILRLPWQLGADFFLRHLLDGDPASNTLSWRWVCGLQTPGKVYRAETGNILKFTEGRCHPEWNDSDELPPIPTEPYPPDVRELSTVESPVRGKKVLIISTVEDLTPEQWGIPKEDIAGAVLLKAPERNISSLVTTFRNNALEDAKTRIERIFEAPARIIDPSSDQASDQIRASSPHSDEILLMPPTVGLLDDGWEGMIPPEISVRKIRRPWDSRLWPYATHGFFRFKKAIPGALIMLA